MNIKKILLLGMIFCSILTFGAKDKKLRKKEPKEKYTIEQAVSEKAQINTTAFSGLAFLTGTFEADSFLPPGKVADFFGFQYMRDIDSNGMGHNTDFLTRVANNVLYILNADQKKLLEDLAKKQTKLYEEYALERLRIVKAFRETLEGNAVLDKDGVLEQTIAIYRIDGDLSYERAVMYVELINSFSEEQKSYLEKMEFNNSDTWPKLEKKRILNKRGYSHEEHVAIMTYASELFSWYRGSIYADVYFCPERIANYFGGFYMKDYPAMGNSDYFISTTVTGDKGEGFLKILSKNHKNIFEKTVMEHKSYFSEIVKIREDISKRFRSFLNGETVEKEYILEKMEEYGRLDGIISYNYTNVFSDIYSKLSTEQKEKLYTLRGLDIYPDVPYKYSSPIRDQIEFDYKKLVK